MKKVKIVLDKNKIFDIIAGARLFFFSVCSFGLFVGRQTRLALARHNSLLSRESMSDAKCDN